MTLSDALTLACLVPASEDTRVSRLFKEMRGQPARLPDLDPGVPDRVAAALGLDASAIPQARQRAEVEQERAARMGLTLLAMGEPGYPPWLAEIADPPIVLWAKGQLADLGRAAVAVVGARVASPAGLAIARQLGQGLASAGLTVVSGLARGVDGASHEGALASGGTTVAVLGSGVEVVYPPEHRALAARVAAAGGLLSELTPETGPRPHHFPLRNRIIAGLCRAVVVVEAGERSGSLITARMALEQGREVLAVPGNVLSGRSRGCHALIKDGARLVETVGDVLEELGWASSREVPSKSMSNSSVVSELERHIPPGEVRDADTLAALTGWVSARLLAELAALEVDGRLARVPGGWTRVLT